MNIVLQFSNNGNKNWVSSNSFTWLGYSNSPLSSFSFLYSCSINNDNIILFLLIIFLFLSSCFSFDKKIVFAEEILK